MGSNKSSLSDAYANRVLMFLEKHENLINADDWDMVYSFFEDFDESWFYPECWHLTRYLHELGFDPLPYMKHVHKNMYYDQEWLTSIEIPHGNTEIESSAFGECHNLSHVSISDSVGYIDEYAFSGCGKLKSIRLPENLKWLGTCAFEYCNSLKEITVPSKGLLIGDYVFDNVPKDLVIHTKSSAMIDYAKRFGYSWDEDVKL